MADHIHPQHPAGRSNLPPPAPPLPPPRFAGLQRLIAPLGLGKPLRQIEDHEEPARRPPPRNVSRSSAYGNLPSQTAAHRTGIPIAAIDINEQKTHAILAGKEILKTVRVQDGNVSEDFNLRSSIVSYASTHDSPQSDEASRRRDFLSARAVRWSSKNYSHIIATAGNSGRIALYDVNRSGLKTEYCWLHEHAGQVNTLDFDVFLGYLLLSGSSDKTVRMWDLREKPSGSTQRYEIHNGVRHVAWSPVEGNDFAFALAADGGLVQQWDARKNKTPVLSIHAHDKGCYSLDWHPDGRHIVSAGFDKYVRVWDAKGDRRQKPVFNLRAPQAVRHVKWRPPCWSSETAETGSWQSTQVALTYHYDDPRMHVWDFRRPLIPFREIDMYNKSAADFLWASKDLIWTCGEEGMFTQNDVNYAVQPHLQQSPCAINWCPDGEGISFTEKRNQYLVGSEKDPAAGFLSVSPGRLKQAGVTTSQAAEEDDPEDVPVESLLSTSFRRRGRLIPARPRTSTASSQATSPKTPEYGSNVVHLDKAVLFSENTFENGQYGYEGGLSGATTDIDIIEFLANNYAPPPADYERLAEPEKILQRLEHCFVHNADICDEASMHRMAQSWRVLQSVVIPEIREWADANRKTRQAEAAKAKKHRQEESQKMRERENSAQSFSKLHAQNGDVKPTKLMSNLFRGVTAADVLAPDTGSSSNMTTPLARPVSGSPRSSRGGHRVKDSIDSTDGIDDLPALPPSLLASHTTAAVAARALVETANVESPNESSLDRPRPEQTNPLSPKNNRNLRSRRQTFEPSPLTDTQRQEERRAALRDYRPPPRPIFTLDAPVRSPDYTRDERHDSSESFPMFPASTSSSNKARSLGQSFESPQLDQEEIEPKRGFPRREDSMRSMSSLDDDDSPQKEEHIQVRDFSDSPSDPSSGKPSYPHLSQAQSDGAFESKLAPVQSVGPGPVQPLRVEPPRQERIPHQVELSSSPDIFQFDGSYSPPRPKIHLINPALHPGPELWNETDIVPSKETWKAQDPGADGYTLDDFRPIDIATYTPTLPFAFSSLPLACQMIAYDAENDVACCQFAAHLLLYLAPYLWHPMHMKPKQKSSTVPRTVAEKLMRPDLAHRILEGILIEHVAYLHQVQLYQSSSCLTKACHGMGFDRVISLHNRSAQESSDPHQVNRTCAKCKAALKAEQFTCDKCRKGSICPICNCRQRPSILSEKPSLENPLWSYCQTCGHAAHEPCIAEWLSQPDSEGRCPTLGCDCDCAPGEAREERLEKQGLQQEESKLLGSRQITTRKDPFRAVQSPAVDKTRAALRASSGERGTQSSDERGKPGRKSSTRSSVGGFGASRKSVRLVTPSEETIVKKPARDV